MRVSFMVRCATEADCLAELDWLCRERGAVVTMLPTDRCGDGWLARAVPMTKAPAVGEGLSVER
ncbi:hypothetical protein ADK52_25545 [Streptomyces sp. WM6372]|uniref:hypothetical protein n=1 Tax=Streptomyces sp. WM6372 TaxID=1415555 RepID=UPI0006AF9EA0|nr:hypothetical protein [Streptomyces sp. WM6372]KOU20954.1 hypothetical protein ADK52_25545 [Streptomyces sp. WM6372]